jgi:hypothetical protein
MRGSLVVASLLSALTRTRPTFRTRDVSEAMSLTLQPGRQLRGIDIRLLPSDLFRFSGHILRGACEGRLEANVLLPGLSIRTVSLASSESVDDVTLVVRKR